jgi:hypothetical protein
VFHADELTDWIATHPRTGETIRIPAATRGAAKRMAASEFTMRSVGTEPDVLAREVILARARDRARVAA